MIHQPHPITNRTTLSIDKVKGKEIYGGNETSDGFPIVLHYNNSDFGFRVNLPNSDGTNYLVGWYNLKDGSRGY